MENQQPDRSVEEVFNLLNRALEVGIYAEFRQRYASEEQWKAEGPQLRREAYMAWYIAKRTIGENRPKFEKVILGNPENFTEKQIATFRSALDVIDKEIETEMELVLTQEIDVDKLGIEEPEEMNEELDEDEQYIQESNKTWDGDEYLGEEDIEFDDEEDLVTDDE